MAFDKSNLDRLREETLAGQLSRRSVLKRAMALGLSAPVIAGLLAACGDDDEEPADEAEPTTASTGAESTEATTEEEPTEAAGEATEAGGEATEATGAETEATGEETEATGEVTEDTGGAEPAGERGGGGPISILYWQAPVIMNAHLASGTKDYHLTRCVCEPFFDWDDDLENPTLQLAAEWPSVENETLDPDLNWVIWKLREGVKWHDGEDFNAEDVIFTWQYITNVDTASTNIGTYITIDNIEALDDYTVKITFKEPYPAWYDPFEGTAGIVLAEHVYRDYVGASARDAPANLHQIGTGPFMTREFRPGDVALLDIFPDYWDPGKPFFDSCEVKGGGDAPSAARAVTQTGEADWAWNLQLEPQILEELGQGSEGEIVLAPGSGTERLMINFANPREEVDGAFAEPSTTHPFLSDVRVRRALAFACPRDVIAEQLYGSAGVAIAQGFDVPAKFLYPDMSPVFDMEQAQALLDEAGVTGGDILYQTSVNSVRQKHQEILKESFQELGFNVELKSVDSSIYFSSDPGNPDTSGHFYADLEMHTNGAGVYPAIWFERYRTDEICQKSNSWSGSNAFRYSNPEFDAMHDQSRKEVDEEKQIQLFYDMGKLAWETDVVEIPQVARQQVAAKNKRIKNTGMFTWAANPVSDLKNWTLNE